MSDVRDQTSDVSNLMEDVNYIGFALVKLRVNGISRMTRTNG